jgi:hypothetical protein
MQAKVLKKNLFLGILFDAVECCLYSAFVWRVFRCYLGTDGILMTRMYKGTAGKVEGGNLRGNCSFTDFIPSFTLMWYHYVIKKES